MGISDFFDPSKASKVKKILICVGLILPALALHSSIGYVLIITDFIPIPVSEIAFGLLGWGIWFLLCGIYLKNSWFKFCSCMVFLGAFLNIIAHA